MRACKAQKNNSGSKPGPRAAEEDTVVRDDS